MVSIKYIDFKIECLKKDKDLYSFSILTNGTLITDEIAKRISEYNPEYVQVSLEGGKKTNDYIRGKNVYKKVATAIKYLKKYNIFVLTDTDMIPLLMILITKWLIDGAEKVV